MSIEVDKDRYKTSNRLLARAEKVIPLGTQTFSKSKIQFPVPFAPLFLERGEAGHVFDVDGHKYVDLISGLLPVTLGYKDQDVDEAIREQLDKGISFSLATTLEIEVAEMLREIIPSAEMVRYGKNGTDATSAAVRLARAYTGRDHIIALGYHGWQDWYIGATARNLGVPEAVRGLTHKLPYNDLAALQSCFAQNKDEIAAIIMEPVSADLPNEGYLEEVKELAHKNGALLIFDEIITGFRVHLGGAQSYYGVTPDLSCFGKGIANGMPLSAIVGRAEIMHMMEDIFYSGTFGGEALSLAAARAVLKKMKRELVVERLWQTGGEIAANVARRVKEHGLEDILSLKGLDCWKVVAFKDHERASAAALKTRFMIDMLAQGILVAGSHNVSYAHTQDDIAAIGAAYKQTLAHIKEELDAGTLVDNLEVPPIVPVFQVRS